LFNLIHTSARKTVTTIYEIRRQINHSCGHHFAWFSPATPRYPINKAMLLMRIFGLISTGKRLQDRWF